MMQQNAELVRLLRAHGHSLTKTRKAVFTALLGKEPVTMAELVRILNGQADRASVYRTVELFEKLAIIHRIYFGWKYKIELAETFSLHHHHFSCLSCGRIVRLDGDTHLEKDIAELADKHGLRLISHQIELQGYCQNCHTE